MANDRDLFFPLFAYGLAFKQLNGPGQTQQSYDQVWQEIATLWEELHAKALSQGMGETDFFNAAFAAVAWLDETILKHPTWEHRNHWRIAPLQLHYYKTRRANETFFERLKQLRPEQTEIREIYDLCLRLGFTGRYSRDIEAIYKLVDRRLTVPEVSPPPIGIPEVSPPPVGVPEVSPPPIGIPEVSPPLVGIPEVSPPLVGIPEVSPPLVGIPEVSPPSVGVPEVSPPPIGIPEVSPPPGEAQRGHNIIPSGSRSLLERVKTLLKRPRLPLQTLSQHVAHFGKKSITFPKQALRQLQDALSQWRWAPWLRKADLVLLIIVPLALIALWWFAPSQQFQLTVDKEGDGSGTLTASPSRDRSCDPSCAKATYVYAKGTVVTLQATPDVGSIFEQWKEAECAQGIALNANKTCTAIFSQPRLTAAPDKEPAQLQTNLQPCAKISNILSQNSHVAEEFQAIGKHRDGVITVNDPLQIIRSSFCDILAIIIPFKNDLNRYYRLEVSLNKPGPNPLYIGGTNGEDLLVRVKTPTEFASYIYIDYYTVSDQVVHLFPNLRQPVNFFVQPSDFTQMARIQEPFGLELVTVIASKTPLFTSPRLGLEQTQSYLTELQKAWPKDDTEIATTFYFITTQGQ